MVGLDLSVDCTQLIVDVALKKNCYELLVW